MKTIHNKPAGRVFFFTLMIFLFFQSYPEEINAFYLSTKEEKVLGQEFLAKIHKYFTLVDDDFINEYINDLGQYLLKPIEGKRFPFHFYIIKDNTLNAFAVPGGHIFIYSGLIEVMDDIDELAAVLSHEIGHITANHLARRIEQSKKIGLATMAGVLAGILIGGKATGALMTGSIAAGIQAQLQYSREDERQADQLGFKYMDKAGFDPSGMITTLKKIQKGDWFGTDKIPPYMLTHPGGTERMSNYDMMLANYSTKPENRETIRFRRLFPFFETILRARYMEPHDAERLFKKELDKNTASILAHTGLGIILKERWEYDQAIAHFKKALRGDPESTIILRNLGEAYQLNGRDTEAVMAFKKALRLDNQDKSTLFLLAMTYQNLERYENAVSLYEKLTLMRPVKNEVFYNLGLSYGRQGRLAIAHYNFALYFKKQNKIEKAGFHLRKASDLAGNNPALRGRIQKAMDDLYKKKG